MNIANHGTTYLRSYIRSFLSIRTRFFFIGKSLCIRIKYIWATAMYLGYRYVFRQLAMPANYFYPGNQSYKNGLRDSC